MNMNILNKIVAVFFIVTLLSCSSTLKSQQPSAQSSTHKSPVKDTIPSGPIKDLWVTTYGFGTTKGSSLQNAIQNGFRALLQDGFEGGHFPHPLLGKEGKTIISNNPAYFDRFFNADMHLFVLDRDISYFEYTSATEPSSKIAILVNVEGLKQRLIADKILPNPAKAK
ncbi:MAG: hypothetical protein IPP37_22015 [Saprospiraceae bacterium]|nr:hypothetical protein [Saprospiraceae bacterium]